MECWGTGSQIRLVHKHTHHPNPLEGICLNPSVLDTHTCHNYSRILRCIGCFHIHYDLLWFRVLYEKMRIYVCVCVCALIKTILILGLYMYPRSPTWHLQIHVCISQIYVCVIKSEVGCLFQNFIKSFPDLSRKSRQNSET